MSGYWLFTLSIKATKVLKPQQRNTLFLQELALSLVSFILRLKTSSTMFHSSREHWVILLSTGTWDHVHALSGYL